MEPHLAVRNFRQPSILTFIFTQFAFPVPPPFEDVICTSTSRPFAWLVKEEGKEGRKGGTGLTAGELEVTDVFVERKAAELHPLAHRRQIAPGMEERETDMT